MLSPWVARLFFALVAVMAIGGVLSGTACTRWGQPGPTIPTVAPISSIYVDAKTGSDSTGNGSMSKPYKSLTKAVEVLASGRKLTSSVTINLASGDYNAVNGELFPIVIPKNVTIAGTNYGFGVKLGTFIDGSGEDTIFERLVHAAPRTAFTTLEIATTATLVNLSSVYVGASRISLPSARAGYTSLDVLGTANAATSSFGAGIVSLLSNVSGVLVAGGAFTCAPCQIRGNDFGIGALSVRTTPSSPSPSSSPSSVGPSITLSHPPNMGDSTIAAKNVGIITDGSVNVTASGQTFELGRYAYEDSLRPVIAVSAPGVVDFGSGGVGNTSSGGNIFIGARTSEISITRPAVSVSALDDTWNPKEQGANRNGQYGFRFTFRSGASGKNVTILRAALGSTVTVGPAPVPTPSPSISPSVSPSPTATPT